MAALPSVAGGAILVSLAVLSLVVGALVAGALKRGGRREDPMDPHDALAVSRFTIPVSLIVPAAGDSATLSRSIASLLSLSYPELEVIVVAERLPERQFDDLELEWALEPKEFFYRRTLTTGPVRRIYGSTRDGRLIVVDKPDGGRADALNCGLCLARFRYIASVAPTVVFDSNALLRMMSPALRDPASVLAVASHVETRAGTGLVEASQWIGSIRSWMATRLTWNGLRCGLGPQHAVVVWRRDALLELGGFSKTAADPELDMLVRLQTSTTDRATGHVVRSGEIVGRTEPLPLAGAARLAGHRQRAVLESLSALRFFSGSTHGRLTVVCFLIAEFLSPALQLCVLVTVLAGAAAGWSTWLDVLLAVALLSFGNAVVTAVALLLRGALPGAPTVQELTRLLLLAPVEYFFYRPAVAMSRLFDRFANESR